MTQDASLGRRTGRRPGRACVGSGVKKPARGANQVGQLGGALTVGPQDSSGGFAARRRRGRTTTEGSVVLWLSWARWEVPAQNPCENAGTHGAPPTSTDHSKQMSRAQEGATRSITNPQACSLSGTNLSMADRVTTSSPRPRDVRLAAAKDGAGDDDDRRDDGRSHARPLGLRGDRQAPRGRRSRRGDVAVRRTRPGSSYGFSGRSWRRPGQCWWPPAYLVLRRRAR